MIDERGAAIDRLERFAARPAALAFVGLWGAGEAVILPVVPDVALCLLALALPRRMQALFAAVIVGAALGTLVLAGLVNLDGSAIRAVIDGLPGIDQSVVAEAERAIERGGVAGFVQFGPGPPLKLHTLAWLADGGDLPGAVAGSIVNRLTRIGPIVVVAAAGGVLFGGWIRRHATATLVAYAAFWVGTYAALWS